MQLIAESSEILCTGFTMKIFGSKELETLDFGDSLQFVLMRNLGWAEIAIEVILLGSITFFAWRQNSVILMGLRGLDPLNSSCNLATFKHGSNRS